MAEVILVVHLLIALALIGSVLLQRSEGGALGIGGGGGGGGSLFSSRGAGSALTRTTALLAAAFIATSVTLTILAKKARAPSSIFDNVPAQTTPGAPKKNVIPVLPKKPSGPAVPVN